MSNKMSIKSCVFGLVKITVFFSAIFSGTYNNLCAQKNTGVGLFGNCHSSEFFHYLPNEIPFHAMDSARVVSSITYWCNEAFDPRYLKYPYYDELHVVLITNSFEDEDLRFQRCEMIHDFLRRSFPELVIKYEFKSEKDVGLAEYNVLLIETGKIVGATACMRSFYIVE